MRGNRFSRFRPSRTLPSPAPPAGISAACELLTRLCAFNGSLCAQTHPPASHRARPIQSFRPVPLHGADPQYPCHRHSGRPFTKLAPRPATCPRTSSSARRARATIASRRSSSARPPSIKGINQGLLQAGLLAECVKLRRAARDRPRRADEVDQQSGARLPGAVARRPVRAAIMSWPRMEPMCGPQSRRARCPFLPAAGAEKIEDFAA